MLPESINVFRFGAMGSLHTISHNVGTSHTTLWVFSNCDRQIKLRVAFEPHVPPSNVMNTNADHELFGVSPRLRTGPEITEGVVVTLNVAHLDGDTAFEFVTDGVCERCVAVTASSSVGLKL